MYDMKVLSHENKDRGKKNEPTKDEYFKGPSHRPIARVHGSSAGTIILAPVDKQVDRENSLISNRK